MASPALLAFGPTRSDIQTPAICRKDVAGQAVRMAVCSGGAVGGLRGVAGIVPSGRRKGREQKRITKGRLAPTRGHDGAVPATSQVAATICH